MTVLPFSGFSLSSSYGKKKNVGQEHPHYSPVLVLIYVHVFTMEGQIFQDNQDIHKYMTAVLRVTLKEELHKCFKYWQCYWATWKVIPWITCQCT